MNIQDIPTDVLIAELNRREDLTNVDQIEPKLNQLGLIIIQEIDKARKDFGDYNFCDKGADEVMHISSIINDLEPMNSKDVADSLSFVLDNYKDKQFSHEAVNTIIGSLDDREDFEDILGYDNRFEY